MDNEYVFDTSTLILLAKITVLRTFAQHKKVVISTSVEAEALAKETLEDAHIIRQLLAEGLIKRVKKEKEQHRFSDDFRLEKGESEALYYSFKRRSTLATDDLPAIKAAKIVDVPFVTAVHCLVWLVKKEKIDRALALEKLKNLERYGRYRPEIVNDAKQQIGEGEKYG